jgi:hypothetical protein
MDSVAFYPKNPDTSESNTALKLYTEAYHNKSELFVAIFEEYRKKYIRSELYAEPMVCYWINLNINNIRNHVAPLPINELPLDNGGDVATTNTVNEQDKSKVVNEDNPKVVNEDKPTQVASYASRAALPPRVPQQPKRVIQKKSAAAENVGFKTIEQQKAHATIEKKPAVVAEASKVNKPVAKKLERTLYSTVQTTRKSPLNDDQARLKKNSFSPLLETNNSDDESDDDNKSQVRSSSAQSGSKNNNSGGKGNKKPTNNKVKKSNDDQEKFWAAMPLVPETIQAPEQEVPTNLIAANQAEVLNNRKAAARRSEALSVMAKSFVFICITPPILNMLDKIIHQTRYDMHTNGSSFSKQFTLAAFCAIYTSQVCCAAYTAKMLKDGAIQYVENQPHLNSMLYGYKAAQQNNSFSIAAKEEKNAKSELVSKKKHKI